MNLCGEEPVSMNIKVNRCIIVAVTFFIFVCLLYNVHVTFTEFGTTARGVRDAKKQCTAETTGNDLKSVNSMMESNVVPNKTWTLVTVIGGELANHLGHIAWAFSIQKWLQDKYHLRIRVLLRDRHRRHLKNGRRDIHQCFPGLKHLDFSEGNQRIVTNAIKKHSTRLKMLYKYLTSSDVGTFERGLQDFVQATLRNGSSSEEQSIISSPLIIGFHQSNFDHFVDLHYDYFRHLFRFDMECCKTVPEIDESVFHFRNFIGEIGSHPAMRDFRELGPNQTAEELFKHLRPGDKIAIVHRKSGKNTVQMYVEAFLRRGLQVRVVEGQTGVQDFCFLMNARKELVGPATSSFARWAGLLSNCSRVRIYSLHGSRIFSSYNFTNPDLRSRITTEFYTAK